MKTFLTHAIQAAFEDVTKFENAWHSWPPSPPDLNDADAAAVEGIRQYMRDLGRETFERFIQFGVDNGYLARGGDGDDYAFRFARSASDLGEPKT